MLTETSQRTSKVSGKFDTLFNLEGATASSVAESRFDHREVPEKHGGVAQLGEHLPCTQGVKGSNPFISTKQRKLRRG